MRIRLAGLFDSYTKGENEFILEGETVAEILLNLEKKFPGIRFRIINEQNKIRQHINIFVNSHKIDEITRIVNNQDELFIVQALSGG